MFYFLRQFLGNFSTVFDVPTCYFHPQIGSLPLHQLFRDAFVLCHVAVFWNLSYWKKSWPRFLSEFTLSSNKMEPRLRHMTRSWVLSSLELVIFRPTFSMGEENHDLLRFFPNFAKIPLCTIPLSTQSPYSAILILSCIYPVLSSYTILIA